MITEIFRAYTKSYKALPLNLYHIQWKFRDEQRPRFGVMRGREFLMKDAYSFDLDEAEGRKSYDRMFVAYLRIFARMGLKGVPIRAETGPIGGDLSHEFIILAPTGESQVYFDAAFEEIDYLASNADGFSHQRPEDLARFFEVMTTHYAATDEKHDTERWNHVSADRRREGRGIEVGHIFYFGTRYTKAMGATVAGPDGKPVHPEMGSYGVGVSRLVGAVIEASHDDAGIIWPDSIAPFKAAILNLKIGDAACDALCEQIYAALEGNALYDDRSDRAGAKFADADLMGHPWQIIVGPRSAAAGKVELKRRATGERIEVAPQEALTRIG
jgi:prolyl-tRNA synthetase